MLRWTVHQRGSKRIHHAAVAVGHKVYSFGGYDYGETHTYNVGQIDVHVFNTVSLRWTKLLPSAVVRDDLLPSAVVGDDLLPSTVVRAGSEDLPSVETTGSVGADLLSSAVETAGSEGEDLFSSEEVPSMRVAHTAVLLGDTVYIFGGIVNIEIETDGGGVTTIRGDKSNALYAFSVDAHRWSKPGVRGSAPEARWGHSACGIQGNVMYVFGGFNLASGMPDDVYKLETNTMVWTLITTRGGTPEPSSQEHCDHTVWQYHSATIIHTKMFVFGGQRNHVDVNTVRVFDTETNLWLKMPDSTPRFPEARMGHSNSTPCFPEGRMGHSAFTYRGELYIFGGHTSRLERTFSDLWKFNPESLSWKRVEPKGKRPCWMSRMSCCMLGDRAVLFGGYRYRDGVSSDPLDLQDDPEVSDDLYILDLGPSLKTLCKLAVVQSGLERSGLPRDVCWELTALDCPAMLPGN